MSTAALSSPGVGCGSGGLVSSVEGAAVAASGNPLVVSGIALLSPAGVAVSDDSWDAGLISGFAPSADLK